MKTSLIHWNLAGEIGRKKENRHHLKVSIMARLRAMVERMAPLGYQDDQGFHYGVKKDKKRQA